MKKKVVIFGTKDMAQLAKFYFENDSDMIPIAFTADKKFCNSESFEGLPLVAFEEVEKQFSPQDHLIFIPMTQVKMGMLRKQKYDEAKAKGYGCAKYISSKASYFGTPVGENTFIFEDNTIQPFTKIGNNVCLWSGNHIGHHSIINDHVFLTSHVVISGHVTIDSFCFFGVNSTVRDAVHVREGTLVAMNAVISHSTTPYGVYFAPKSTFKEGIRSTDLM